MAADPRFTIMLRERLKNKRRLPRPPRILHPDPVIRAYRTALLARVARIKELVNQRLIPRLQHLIELRDHKLPDGIKQDAWPDDLQSAFRGIDDDFTREYTPEEAAALARKMGVSVAEFNAQQLDKVWRRVVGVDVFASEPWLGDQLSAFSVQNTEMIEGLGDDLLGELSSGILDQMSSGSRFEEIAEWIGARFGIADRRAEFIARDQVGTLNGQLTGLRQTNAGVKGYIWRTSNDERVRDSHRDKEGKTFSWDDPPADTGHPGEDYNCRCYPEPDFGTTQAGSASYETGAGDDE